MARRSLIAAVVASAALIAPGSALGHATVKSKRVSGKSATLTFSEKVAGKVTYKGKSKKIKGKSVKLTGLKKGSYTAKWTIVADDGHAQKGTWKFKVK